MKTVETKKQTNKQCLQILLHFFFCSGRGRVQLFVLMPVAGELKTFTSHKTTKDFTSTSPSHCLKEVAATEK